jgi:beta-N-acetylglucosaminidase
MKRVIVIISIIVFSIGTFAQTKSAAYLAYIEQYRDMAIEQQIKHKIPAAITMAQGLLESGAGKSKLAVEANNHFGIKCASGWVGLTFAHDDDAKDECFRKYATPADSYEDHSLFLKRKRYASLFALPIADYKGWAHGLKACGYATDPKYAYKLINLIELYELQKLTLDTTLVKAGIVSEKDTTWQNTPNDKIIDQTNEDPEVSDDFSYLMVDDIALNSKQVLKRFNGSRYIIAVDGDTYASLAIHFNMYERTLRKYNDALDTRDLQPGDIVYVYPKKNKASRKTPFCYFREGDDAWKISQKYGIKMYSLYKLNGIPFGTKLTTTQRLELR